MGDGMEPAGAQSPEPGAPPPGSGGGGATEHHGPAFNKRPLPAFYDRGDRFMTLRIGDFSWDMSSPLPE